MAPTLEPLVVTYEGLINFSLAYTFDAVFVHPEYRGLGLHSEFIKVAKEQAKIDGVSSIWSTVASENTHSYVNFEKAGFYAYKKGVSMYGGHTRDILKFDL